MDAHAVLQKPPHLFGIRTGELRSLHDLFDLSFFRRGAEVQTHQILRRLRGIVLGEMDEVDRCLVRCDQLL